MADIYEKGLEPARFLVDNAHLLPKEKALDVAAMGRPERSLSGQDGL